MLTLDLSQFTGSQTWTRHPLYPNTLLSEGVVHLANTAGAWWLAEAILSHICYGKEIRREQRKNEAFARLHFWYLEPKGNGAVLTARTDSEQPPVVSQRIGLTDFPFDEGETFTLYCGDDGPNTPIKLFLPSEY